VINWKACANALINYFGGSKPVLLADLEYRRKTKSDLLRHPSYKGLREDLME
jgi:ATP-dependent DNA ligase